MDEKRKKIEDRLRRAHSCSELRRLAAQFNLDMRETVRKFGRELTSRPLTELEDAVLKK
jgi:hypothetical protein